MTHGIECSTFALIMEDPLSSTIESFHFDIPSFSRPPVKPPGGNTGILNVKMMGYISEQKVPIPRPMITIVSNQEKSPDILSHQGLRAFQHFATCPMMIHGKNTPILDVPLFHFYPLDQLKYRGIWHRLSSLSPDSNPKKSGAISKKARRKRIEEEQAAKAQNSKIPTCSDDDDDYNSAVTPNEPVDSLSMGNEHFNTIPAMESDEFIKSCVENHVPNPSKSEGENVYDVLACFTTFSNILFDAEYEFESFDDQSCSDKDVPEKIFSNPWFEEEINSMRIDQHHFYAESDLIESLFNRDSSIFSSSSKIDSLLDEFAGELTFLKSILPGIDETDCHPENEIRLTKRLLYDNSSHRPPKEFVSENSNAEIESFSPSLIPIKDSDSFMEEIDLTFTPDDPMPSSIKDDDDDSEGDNLFLERLLHDDPIPFPDTLDFSYDVRVFLPFFTYLVTFSILHSFGNEDTIFDPGIAINHFFIRLSRLYLIGVELSRNSILTYSRKLEDSRQRILSSNSSFPQLHLGIIFPSFISLEMSIQEIEDLKQQYLDEMKRLINSEYRDEIKIAELKENFNSMSIEINKKEKLLQLEQVANLSTYPSKRFNSFSYDDDDDEDYATAVTPCLSTEEPDNFLSMGDEHLDTISAMKSEEFIKSSVENLVPIPSESEGESKCDVPAREEFTTFSNILFDAEYEFDSSDDQSFYDEDVPKKIFSNPLFEEEIIHMKIEQHHYNAESDLIESLCTHDSSIIISLKIDSLFDEFIGELTLLKSIPPGIDETDCYPEEETHFIKRLLYDNSSPRPSEEFVSANADTKIESFSSSPIPVEDSDSLMEEIDLSFTLDYPMSPGIKDDEYDSKRDILILKDFPSNDTLSFPAIESFHFDIPSFYRPPVKPPDGNTGILNVKMMGDISEQKVPIPRPMITLASNQEKSPDILSHHGLRAFQHFATCSMMIHRKNTPILDVPLFHFYPS
nr:hypothetical protein [Tanacetum cinerariifolium]